MVSVLVGSRVNQQRAWRWLQSQYESGQYVGCIPEEEKKPEKPKIARIPAKDFYWSDEWRALRYRRLKDSDGCCCLCGRSRRAHGIVLHVDHIKPRSKHPEIELVFENTQVLCEDCNLGKSNRCDRDWR
jgi:5-methylcytosine-specific restriction endonuclease McrA